MPEPANSAYRERNSTADRTLDILTMFGESVHTVTVPQVSERLGVARSTAYRYLQSLVQGRFLEESDKGGFRLGLRILELAHVARQGLSLTEMARPLMRELALRIGETVLLTRRAGGSVICLERAEAESRSVRISYSPGQLLPGNAGAATYALLAWLDETELDRALDEIDLTGYTSTTPRSREAMLARIAQTRASGYAVSRGELDVDVLGIAAPVRVGKTVTAALGVAAVARNQSDAEIKALTGELLDAASELAKKVSLLA